MTIGSPFTNCLLDARLSQSLKLACLVEAKSVCGLKASRDGDCNPNGASDWLCWVGEVILFVLDADFSAKSCGVPLGKSNWQLPEQVLRFKASVKMVGQFEKVFRAKINRLGRGRRTRVWHSAEQWSAGDGPLSGELKASGRGVGSLTLQASASADRGQLDSCGGVGWLQKNAGETSASE